jgi:hypothetical protein
MSWENDETWKHLELRELQQRWEQSFREKSDQELKDRYTEEKVRLKMILQWKQQGQGERPCSHPNTMVMNRCRRELERRNVLIPE